MAHYHTAPSNGGTKEQRYSQSVVKDFWGQEIFYDLTDHQLRRVPKTDHFALQVSCTTVHSSASCGPTSFFLFWRLNRIFTMEHILNILKILYTPSIF
jgi:hypothetical protein